MNNAVKTFAAAAAFTLLAGAAHAQTPPPAPPHQGLFSKLFHPKPKPGTMMPMHSGAMTPMHSGMMPRSGMANPMHSGMMGGQFIGNKKTHVFHIPGDTGSLPAPQNRVYFSSAAAAQAAGYHAAGGRAMTHQKTMMQH